MEFVVDIRPSSPDLNLDKVTEVLAGILEEKKLRFDVINRTHNLGAWYTELDDIKEFVEIVKKITGQKKLSFDNPGDSGYLGLQMLWDKVGRPISLMFGGGNGDTAHKPNEHIKIEDLIKERGFFKKVLEKYSSK
jgi:acetylornithine deacetylase/succinyl-diaminopimelate desuccinylase-like protein